MSEYHDNPEEQIYSERTEKETDKKCPNCGATVVFDPATGHLSYCNAGHPSPIIGTDEIRQLSGEEESPVGIEPGKVYALEQTVIAPDSLLFLYTGSLLDIRDAKEKPFGAKRTLGEALQARKTTTSPDEFLKNMSEAVLRFTGGKVVPPMLALQYK